MINFGFTSLVKIVAISTAIVAISGLGYKLYRTIQLSGQYEVELAVQKKSIENLNNTIDNLRRERELIDQIVTQRDKQVKQLEAELEDITKDLGDDAKDLAPSSIRELLRRLK